MKRAICLSLLLLLNSCAAFAQPSSPGFISMTEEDASPECFGYQIKVANSALTDNGDGTCSIAAGAGGLSNPIADDTNLSFGTDSDWNISYEEADEDTFSFHTAKTASSAINNAMMTIAVDTGNAGMTANQDVFEVGKGGLDDGDASFTSLFRVDEDGDTVVDGTLTVNDSVGITAVRYNFTNIVQLQDGSGTADYEFENASGNTMATFQGDITDDELRWGLQSGTGRNFILTDASRISSDHGHNLQTNPLFCVHSAAATNTQFICLSHNQTDVIMDVGTGKLQIADATQINYDRGTGEGQMRLDGSGGGCLILRDTDDAGDTACDALNGVLSCEIDTNGICGDGT